MFKHLEETSSSASESEDIPPPPKKSKTLIAKVVELRDRLQREDTVSSEKELTPALPSPVQLLNKKAANTKRYTILPDRTSGQKVQVEEIKLQNIQLLEKQTVLQNNLERAVREKNFLLADTVNDRICSNDSVIKLNQTVIEEDCRNKLREKEALKVRRKRKKLDWVFETKKKWETKSNM